MVAVIVSVQALDALVLSHIRLTVAALSAAASGFRIALERAIFVFVALVTRVFGVSTKKPVLIDIKIRKFAVRPCLPTSRAVSTR